MKLLAYLCSLSCALLVSLVQVNAIYTGHTISQEAGKLPTKRGNPDWADTSSPQQHCFVGKVGGELRAVSSDFIQNHLPHITSDCKELLNATKNRNGKWNIAPGQSLLAVSHGSCVLSVVSGNVDMFKDKSSIQFGNSDIVDIVNATLSSLLDAELRYKTNTYVEGTSWCYELGVVFPLTWTMILNESLATNHQAQPAARHMASLTEREASYPWVSTPDSPARMCSNTTDAGMVTGNGTSTYNTVISNCTDLEEAYNLNNNGYYNISIDAEDRGKFITLATHGVCSLSVIAPSADNVTGSVSFQLGNSDIFDIMGAVNHGLYNLDNLGGDAAINDTAGALGLVFCGDDEGIMVKYAVAFHDFEPGEKLGDQEGTVPMIGI